jgi:hypothetical protein
LFCRTFRLLIAFSRDADAFQRGEREPANPAQPGRRKSAAKMECFVMICHPPLVSQMKKQIKFVDKYPVVRYRCGLIAGEKLRLKKDIISRHATGKPTGKVLRSGGIWTVLKGATESPRVLWLRQPDGVTHTWSDDASVFEDFERIGEANENRDERDQLL